jgi:aerobic carbon-monoxide dehydrogenase medium subunit
MKAPKFDYRCSEDCEAVLSMLAAYGGDAQVLAGGQSLIPAMNMRLASPRILLDINHIANLRGIQEREQSVRIGSIVRHAEILEAEIVARRIPLLALAVPYIGHMAVRNRGTIGGSIAFADPSAEMPAIAVALNARITLRKAKSERVVPAREFFQGLYQTARQDDELVSEIVFPVSEPDNVFGFAELSRRRGDFATVGVAASGRKLSDGTLDSLTVVVFGSEAMPLLVQVPLTLPAVRPERELTEVVDLITRRMDPISNHQGRADTKRTQAQVLLKRTLIDMAFRATHG